MSILGFKLLGVILLTLFVLVPEQVVAAPVKIAGSVAGNNGKAIEGVNITINRADPGPSQFFPKTTKTGSQGGFQFDVPESEFGDAPTLRVSLTAKAPDPQVATRTITATMTKPGQTNVPLITLAIPGNRDYRPGSDQDSTTPQPSIIDYFSPDISPLAEGKKFTNVGEYLFFFIRQAMILAVVAATLMVVYAGFTYLNSGGSPEATSQAKGMIQGALLGLATVFLMAAFLVSLVKIEPSQPSTSSGSTTAPTGSQQPPRAPSPVEQGKVAAAQRSKRIMGLVRNITDCQRIYDIIAAEVARGPQGTFNPYPARSTNFNVFKQGFVAECNTIRGTTQS